MPRFARDDTAGGENPKADPSLTLTMTWFGAAFHQPLILGCRYSGTEGRTSEVVSGDIRGTEAARVQNVRSWVIAETDVRSQKEGKECETNPIKLISLLSVTYGKDERNKPNGHKPNGFSDLQRNNGAFWRNLYDIAPNSH
jgi:hypothetical protein